MLVSDLGRLCTFIIQIFAVDLDFDHYKVGLLKCSSCVGERMRAGLIKTSF